MKTTVNPSPMPTGFSEVEIPCGDVDLEGDLTVPAGACCIVLFVHGAYPSGL